MNRSLPILLALAIALTACGRRGDLEPPAGYQGQTAEEEDIDSLGKD